jgi:hypothetical protein
MQKRSMRKIPKATRGRKKAPTIRIRIENTGSQAICSRILDVPRVQHKGDLKNIISFKDYDMEFVSAYNKLTAREAVALLSLREEAWSQRMVLEKTSKKRKAKRILKKIQSELQSFVK